MQITITPDVPTSSRCTMPCRSEAPLVAIRNPAAGQVADDGRPGPAGRGVHGDADRLVDHDDRRVVVDDLDALDDLRHDLERVGLDRDASRRAVAPASTRSLLAARRRRRCTRPRAIRSAARVRESPNSWASAASTRSPARPSGTGRAAVVCARAVRAARVRAGSSVSAVDPRCRRAGCRGTPAAGSAPAATLMQMSATLKIGQCGSMRKSTTWPRSGPGSRKSRSVRLPVMPASSSPRRDRPHARCRRRRLSQSTTSTATIASAGEHPV